MLRNPIAWVARGVKSRAPRYRGSAGGLELVVEAETRDLFSEMDAYLAGSAVVDGDPESRVNNLVPELGGSVEVVHGIEVAGEPAGSKPGMSRSISIGA